LTLERAAELSKKADALSQITITDGENGSVHNDYTLPVSVTLTKRDEAPVVIIKLAQKSVLEIAQEQQAAELNNTQMALIEIAGMIEGGDNNG